MLCGTSFFVEDRNDWQIFSNLLSEALSWMLYTFLICKNWTQGSKFTLAWLGMVMFLLSLVGLQWKIPASLVQVYLEMMLTWPLSCTWASSNTCVPLPDGSGVQVSTLSLQSCLLLPVSMQVPRDSHWIVGNMNTREDQRVYSCLPHNRERGLTDWLNTLATYLRPPLQAWKTPPEAAEHLEHHWVHTRPLSVSKGVCDHLPTPSHFLHPEFGNSKCTRAVMRALQLGVIEYTEGKCFHQIQGQVSVS